MHRFVQRDAMNACRNRYHTVKRIVNLVLWRIETDPGAFDPNEPTFFIPAVPVTLGQWGALRQFVATWQGPDPLALRVCTSDTRSSNMMICNGQLMLDRSGTCVAVSHPMQLTCSGMCSDTR